LVRQIEWLRGFGIRDVVLAVGYLKHKIFEALGDGRRFGVRIFYSVEGDADGAIALVPLRSPYGIVEFDAGGYVTHFREKPILEGFYINAGVYALRRRVLSELPDRGNIEETLFPRLAQQRRLKAVVYRDVFWKSVDSLKDLEEVDRFFGANNEH
jgi:NDP-sugar pyrophosphorylase family protein